MKSPNDFHNEVATLIHPYLNEGIETCWDMVNEIVKSCFEQAARMVEENKTADEIRVFSKRVR